MGAGLGCCGVGIVCGGFEWSTPLMESIKWGGGLVDSGSWWFISWQPLESVEREPVPTPMDDEPNPYEPPAVTEVETVVAASDRRPPRRPLFWMLATFVSSIVSGGLITAGAPLFAMIASLAATAMLCRVTWVRYRRR